MKIYSYERTHDVNYILRKQIIYINVSKESSLQPSLFKIFLFIENYVRTVFLLFREKFKIVFATELYSLIILSSIKKFLFRDLILVIRLGFDIEKYIALKPFSFYRRILHFLTRFSLTNCNAAVYTSNSLRQNQTKKFELARIPYQIIPNGIFLKNVNRYAKQLITKNEEKIFTINKYTLVSIGRFAPQKDFETIIRAFGRIKKINPDCSLVLIGDGELKKNYRCMVKKIGLTDVFFLGWKKNIYPYLYRSTIFIFASRFEGFGYTLIEAMSQGLPVVATNTKFGPEEILDCGRFGILVPQSDDKTLAHKVLWLLDDKSRIEKYASLSKTRVLQYEALVMEQKYLLLIESLLKHHC